MVVIMLDFKVSSLPQCDTKTCLVLRNTLTGVPATEQLKDQYSQRPAVSWTVMAFVQDDLRGDVLRSTTKRPRLLTQTNLLSKAKVHLCKRRKHTSWIFSLWSMWRTSYKHAAATPALRIPGGPGWCSQVWGLCRWFLWSAGKPEPLRHSPCRSEWRRHQMIPCNRSIVVITQHKVV